MLSNSCPNPLLDPQVPCLRCVGKLLACTHAVAPLISNRSAVLRAPRPADFPAIFPTMANFSSPIAAFLLATAAVAAAQDGCTGGTGVAGKGQYYATQRKLRTLQMISIVAPHTHIHTHTHQKKKKLKAFLAKFMRQTVRNFPPTLWPLAAPVCWPSLRARTGASAKPVTRAA